MTKLHVIVQAGGRGSRLRHHTWNKPKCLVSAYGKPILYHLFDTFPDAKFLIIGDYLFDQLEKYLSVNVPPVEYSLHRAHEKGTASGVSGAFAEITPGTPTVLVWSDLIIKDLPPWPETDKPVVCITSSFTCRWTVASTGDLQEKPGSKDGVPGIFYFPGSYTLPNPPASGEFVRWFSKNITDYDVLDTPDLEELGDFHVIEENNERLGFSRFFNSVEMTEDKVSKTVIDKNYETVHENEVNWYREAQRLGFRRIPRIYSEKPLIMERVNGNHAFQLHDLTAREQRALMADYLDSLIALHDLGKAQANPQEVSDVYYKKTVTRVRSIASLIPGFEQEALTINGRKCRNVFAPKYESVLESLLPELQPARFVPIHGDPTFSNTLIDNKLRAWFIDPRGYFANPGIMGDAWYDFAKVYYSAIGGYDAFNRRQFKLYIDTETVEVLMDEPLLSRTSKEIFKDYFPNEINRIEIIHGLIWLALSGYVKDDIDSIIGSFYMGLYWLEKRLLSMKSSLALSPLPHTWLIDIDGTILLHNGHKDDQERVLPGVQEFWKKIPEQDVIILMTARTSEHMGSTFALLKRNGLRYDQAIFNLPVGERIIINDQKPGGLMTAVALNVPRNHGLSELDVVIREYI